jgi:hypothetical protein
MTVNGFGIGFLLALTMVIIFLKFVRVFTPTPTGGRGDRLRIEVSSISLKTMRQ